MANAINSPLKDGEEIRILKVKGKDTGWPSAICPGDIIKLIIRSEIACHYYVYKRGRETFTEQSSPSRYMDVPLTTIFARIHAGTAERLIDTRQNAKLPPALLKFINGETTYVIVTIPIVLKLENGSMLRLPRCSVVRAFRHNDIVAIISGSAIWNSVEELIKSNSIGTTCEGQPIDPIYLLPFKISSSNQIYSVDYATGFKELFKEDGTLIQ